METLTQYLAKKPKPLNSKATSYIDTTKNFHFIVANDGGRLFFYHDGVQIEPKHIKDFTLEGWHTKNPTYTRWQRIKRGLNYAAQALIHKEQL